MSRAVAPEDTTPGVHPELAHLLYSKADELITRLLDRYLPSAERGYVGDDTAQAQPARKDPYRVLGLKRSATDEDVRRRLRELAKVFHPDRPDGDAEKMTEANDAARLILEKLGKGRG